MIEIIRGIEGKRIIEAKLAIEANQIVEIQIVKITHFILHIHHS